MSRRRAAARLFWRTRGDGIRRAYGDFRDYADVGGKREALIAPGHTRATEDPEIATVLLGRRLEALEARRRGQVILGGGEPTTLGEAARRHLIAKAESGKYADSWLEASERYLGRVLDILGAGRDPRSITVRDVQALVAQLRRRPTHRRAEEGGYRTLGEGSIRHHLNVLSNLFRRLGSEQAVPPGFNPVAALLEKPAGRPQEAAWLEVPEAARVLEAARHLVPLVGSKLSEAQVSALRARWEAGGITKAELGRAFGVSDVLVGKILKGREARDPVHRAGVAYPLLATFLLTGGRASEVLGLELDDVSLERRTVTFRPNRWRRLKTKGSHRVVPLWPQLEEVLREYLRGPDRPTGELLFPALVGGREQVITDFRKTLNAVALGAELLTRGEGPDGRPRLTGRFLRTKMFRHTYCAARLQTLDHGAPVSIYTVSRELGHGSEAMVRRVYGHLGQVRHRAEVVEFRPTTLPSAPFGELAR